TNTDPGGVATGSNFLTGMAFKRLHTTLERSAPFRNPVATAPGSVFVDPQRKTLNVLGGTLARPTFCAILVESF
ncbi:MAG TPA: hypothetical protein VGW36_05895, partial [Pyrinomonadaceae bacterium]|nr:hypothetical protein [Pyrinomonadaceae bacterium]